MISTQRQLVTFADEKDVSCSRVSVKGDATYCIKGPVCGALDESSKSVQGACPAQGDAAVEHCVKTSRSYTTDCVAPVDAQCVISAPGQWECVFPDVANTTTPPSQAPTFSSTTALSATTTDANPESESNLAQGPNTALNVVVGVSCCVLALVGLVMIKKRRDRRNMERDSTYRLSPSDVSIVLV